MRKQFNLNTGIMSKALTSSIQRGTAATWYAPLATQQMDVNQWMSWLDKESAVRKDGTTYPAAYAAINSAPYAVSEVSRRLYAANLAGLMPYTQAVHQANAFKAIAEAVATGLAGQLRLAHAEVPAASIRMRSKGQGGEARRELTPKQEFREAVEDLLMRFRAGEIDQAQVQIAHQELKEHYELNRWDRDAQDNGVKKGGDGASPDEGMIEVALHEVSDLWNYSPREIMGMESAMVEAIVQWKGIDLPTSEADYELFMGRLADTWATALEYAKPEDREALQTKIEYRGEIAEKGLMAMPWKARWAVNHLTRRAWRDIQMLKARLSWMEERTGETGHRMAQEEKYGLPPVKTRLLTEQPPAENQDGTDREFYLYWDSIRERDIAPGFEYHDGRGVKRLSQGEYEILLNEALIPSIESMIQRMQALYAKLRAVDEALTPVWAVMFDPDSEVVMPEQPPVYWNNKGFYLTEEEALAALDAERAEQQQKKLEGAADLISQMLAAQGLIAL